jgi:glycosyltransferase involved in cell wall biosynthesis
MTSISIVIPTKDRIAILERTLDAIEAQRHEEVELEVVLVDNGSSDETVGRMRVRSASSSIPLKLVEQPEGGPAGARNAGLAVAKGEVIFFLGDDTEPEDDGLVEAHRRLHEQNPSADYAVLGRITWTPRRPVTPHMHWLENGGPQFDYNKLEAGTVDASLYFYTSHASVKRASLDRVGKFDEALSAAALEDTELGGRLAAAGVVLDYHPELLVLHDHPTTPAQSMNRALRVGRAAALYNRLHPDRPNPGVQPPDGVLWTLVSAIEPLLDWLARRPLPPLVREKVWLAAVRAGYARGYREAEAEAT